MKDLVASVLIALSIVMCTLLGFYAGMRSSSDNSFSEGVRYGNESCYSLVDYAFGYKQKLSE
jgi:hypothetical protein